MTACDRPAEPSVGVVRTCGAAVMLATLFVPLLGMALGVDLRSGARLVENRPLDDVPDLHRRDWEDVPAALGTWFEDRFAFRTALVQAHNGVRQRWLGVSPEKVLLGEDDWLYFRGEPGQPLLADRAGRRPFTRAQLDRWRLYVLSRRAWLAERGVRHLFVVVPNKATVCDGHLPQRIRRRRGTTRLDQLAAHLAEAGVEVVDLRSELRALAATGLEVYHPRDTHWNGHGQRVHQRRLAAQLRRWWPDFALPEPLTVERFWIVGDLNWMRGVAGVRETDFPVLLPAADLRPAECRPPDELAERLARDGADLAVNAGDPAGPRLLLLGDSFSFIGHRDASRPPLAAACSLSIVTSSGWGEDGRLAQWVEFNRPDVVIEERVERHLLAPVPEPDADMLAALRRADGSAAPRDELATRAAEQRR